AHPGPGDRARQDRRTARGGCGERDAGAGGSGPRHRGRRRRAAAGAGDPAAGPDGGRPPLPRSRARPARAERGTPPPRRSPPPADGPPLAGAVNVALDVTAAPHVLVVTVRTSSVVALALAERGMRVERIAPDAVATRVARLDSGDVVVLDDVAGGDVPAAAL